MTTDPAVGRRGSALAFAAYLGALLMTIWALFMDLVTFATSDYSLILVEAICCAAGSVMLLCFAWSRMPAPGRAIAAVLILVDVYVLWNAGVERLLRW